MSGHSKWSKIKRTKGVADQKKGKVFTRCIHEITVAVREGGGGDPNGNARLRIAIDKAKAVNMPNANIDRAIRRATGEEKGEEAWELSYEGYGPGGTAVLIHVLTNNKNRTVGDVRHAFTRAGGALGETNCVSWMFDKKGLILIDKKAISEDKLMELALEAGAEDVNDDGELWEVITAPGPFYSVKQALEAKVKLDEAEIKMLPKTRIELSGHDSDKMLKLIEVLEDLDDVLDVSVNCDFED